MRRASPGGGSVRFQAHVTPRSRRDEVAAAPGEKLVRVRVTVPPENGEANRATLALLRRRLGLEARALRLVGGASSRRKWIQAEGLDEAELWRRLGAQP